MKLRAWFADPLRWFAGPGGLPAAEICARSPWSAAPAGLALGGGCEILLHCYAVQAHAETYIGLVETGVGIVPAWGGCKEMLLRRIANRQPPFGPMPPVIEAFRDDRHGDRREIGRRRRRTCCSCAPATASP